MSFRKLKNYDPETATMDPRLDLQWAINSTNCLITITPWPTFSQLLQNEPGGISDTTILGAIANIHRNETVHINTFYDIGNKNAIFIPGKTMGQVSLDSGFMESVNLLGGIYETILSAFELKYKVRFADIKKKILSTPKLNTVYAEKTSGRATAVQATPAGSTEISSDEGALLLSLTDIRTKLKFGVILLYFQKEERIKEVAFTNTEDFKNNTETRFDLLGKSGLNTGEVKYSIMTGIFLENCIIQSYSHGINANSAISTPMESVSFLYSNARNIKENLSVVNQVFAPPVDPAEPAQSPTNPIN